MDIEELQKKVIEFRDARDWAQFQSKRSEVRAPEIRGRRTAKNQKSEPQNSRATFGFASGYAVLRRTALSKLEINEKKYPVEKAKGCAKKSSDSTRRILNPVDMGTHAFACGSVEPQIIGWEDGKEKDTQR